MINLVEQLDVSYNAINERSGNAIGSRIAEARKRCGLSLVALSERLSEYGVTVTGGSINKWETGLTTPSGYQLLAIAFSLNIKDIAQYFTLDYKPKLNEKGLSKLAEYEKELVACGLYDPNPAPPITYIEMPLSYLPASAGPGQFLDGDSFEFRSFPANEIPQGSEFGLCVSGDSMEPVYHDGQIVWVRRCDQLNIGDVGIYIYGGEGYIKVYNEQEPSDAVLDVYTDSYGTVHKQPVLMSYNCKYSPIQIDGVSDFRIVGKVLN